MRTDWVNHDDVGLVLRLLTPTNSLVCEFALVTGLRINDILCIRTDEFKQRMYVLEHKTGKRKRIYIPLKLFERIQKQCGGVYVFPHAYNPEKHRTRQAVYKDIKRAARALRLDANIAPHSMRKCYAVEIYRKSGLEATRRALNHSDSSVTLIYILSELADLKK